MRCDDHDICDNVDHDNHAKSVHDNNDHDVEVVDKSRASIAAARCIVLWCISSLKCASSLSTSH